MLKFLFLWLLARFKTRQSLLIENIALRHQLQIYKRRLTHPRLTEADRRLLVWVSRRLAHWRNIICVVRPETVLAWHRKGFRWYWSRKTKRFGRPAISGEIRKLIREMSITNPLWGAPRIRGELLKLGIEIAQSTVEKYMARKSRPPSQSWLTFLKNYAAEIAAIDFFSVPTIHFKLLTVLVILSHDRRKILGFAVTKHPTSAWVSQQLRNAFSEDRFPKYLLHDRDACFSGIGAVGFEEVITAKASPWQNSFCERVIGSIRRECVDHFLVFSEFHLQKILDVYLDYYNESRTHMSLNFDPPVPRQTDSIGRVLRMPKVFGLHSKYERKSA